MSKHNRELRIRRAGPLTTTQDAGRPGYAHLGVPRSGAADAGSLARANHAVGNPCTAAGLEITLGGLVATTGSDVVAAVAGASGPATVGGDTVPIGPSFDWPAGTELRLGTATAGLRRYLAVRGGIAVEPVLGSRSTDVLSGLGPSPVRDGDRVPIGDGGTTGNAATGEPGHCTAQPDLPAEPTIRILTGPRADWFDPMALDILTSSEWMVTPASNRIGIRLDGPTLERRDDAELPSEGLVEGAIQVPPGSGPVLFLADHPTTGGYPVLAVVHPDDLYLAAQARPGSTLRFRLTGAG